MGFGTSLFEESYYDGTQLLNPNSSYVAKNSTANISIYQKGNSNAVNDVGISINISLVDNSTAVPKQNISTVNFSVTDQPPRIDNIIFYINGLNINQQNFTELNTTVTAKLLISDDRGINTSAGYANLTVKGPSESVNFSLNTTSEVVQSGSRYLQMNFTGNFTPSRFGLYNFSAWIKDINENVNATLINNFTLTSLGNTTLNLSMNISTLINLLFL